MNIKQRLSLLLCAVLLCVCVQSVGAAAQPSEGAAVRSALTDDDFLSAKGRTLVNRRGEKVVLKGVNLGAWMIWEDWLCPYEEATDHYDVLSTLTQRFGEEKAYALMNAYMDQFITESDLDRIAAMGFNCVRAPFWFRNFYYDDNGRKILDREGNWEFSRLDWLVEGCKARGIYVILDLHGAVGYQSDAPHSGKGSSVGLYDKTEQGERFRALTDELWTAIAARFAGNPAVAMYDLLNEPMCDVNCTEVRRRINNESIYNRLYQTVRAVDADHLISVECIWTALALPHKALKGWTNVVYQVHFYQTSNFIFNLFVWLTRIYYANTPLLMGEFYPHGSATWKNCFATMNKAGYSWMLWTYKATGHGMWSGDWCIFGSRDGFERAKVQTDSYEEILRKWGDCQRTENGFVDNGHFEADVKCFL